MAGDPTAKRPGTGSPEIALWSLLIVLGGLFVFPGLGIVLALVLDFTRLKADSRAVRVFLVLLGVAVLAFQVFGLFAVRTSGSVSPATPAH